MNILMFTNTYLPHVGGVARSIHGFVEELEKAGNRIRVVAPQYPGVPVRKDGVFRVPAIQDFNGSGFSVPLPAPRRVASAVQNFIPDIIHSHHPFLLGNTALRYASYYRVPLVFTHHTLYELYTHYIPGDSVLMKRFIVNLAVSYCNHCDHVIAPSTSVVSMLKYRGVKSPVSVIPTGVNQVRFSRGGGEAFRIRLGIPVHAFVVGHVGRLAREKNLEYLTLALTHYLGASPSDHALIVGVGPMEELMRRIFSRHGLGERVHFSGILDELELPGAYQAMDVFAFASRSETQGLVIMEAFASGLPVVALDGPGVRDVVQDGLNGRLIAGTDIFAFVHALIWVKSLGIEGKKRMEKFIRDTAGKHTMEVSAAEVLSLYRSIHAGYIAKAPQSSIHKRMLVMESRKMGGYLSALAHALTPAARELYSCGTDLPPDTELQSLIAQHSRIRARFLGFFISLAIRTLKLSWQMRIQGMDIIRGHLAGGEPVLLSFWHGKYLPLFALMEGLHGCIFASCSFRGEVIAEICRRFGYECILIPDHARKSSVQIMAKAILHYGAGAVAADGPRGPGRMFKPGSVQLSSELGMTVIPISVASHPKLVARRRWDLFETPLPFSRIVLMAGEGMVVPVGLRARELDFWSYRLKNELDRIDRRAGAALELERMGKKGVLPSRRFLHVIQGSKA
jgi:1,2-diacylglycerol 3-alpha-glucosyltransferase